MNAHRWSRFALPLILLMQVALGLAHIAVVPPWSGHEPDYVNVTRFLLDNGRVPTASDYPDGNADTPQATQPPLIFLLYAPIVAAFEDQTMLLPPRSPVGLCLGQTADSTPLIGYAPTQAYDQPTRGIVAAGYALRLLSLAFALLTTGAIYATGRTLFDDLGAGAGRIAALTSAAAFAFFPQSVDIATTISNDALLMPLAALNLWLLARFLRDKNLRDGALALVVALLTLLAKLNGWAVLGLTLLAFAALAAEVALGALVRAGRARRTPVTGTEVSSPAVRDRRFVWGAGFFGLAILALIALGAFNLSQYGTILGRYRQLDTMVADQLRNASIPAVVVRGVAEATRLALLEPLDALNTRAALRTGYSVLVIGGLLAGTLGLLVSLVWRPAARRAHIGAVRLLLLVVTVLIAMGLVLFRNAGAATAANTTDYSATFIYTPLRYYAQAFPAAALLLGGGLVALLWPAIERLGRSRAALAVIPALFALVFAIVFGLVSVLWLVRLAADGPAVEYLTPAALAARVAAGEVMAVPDSADASRTGAPGMNAPRALGYTLAEHPAAGLLDVTVYAQLTPGQQAASYLPEIAWGESSCQGVPGRGVYPTTRWPTDAVVAFTLTVPQCAALASNPLPVSLRWWLSEPASDPKQPTLLADAASPAVALGQTAPPTTTAANCPPTYGSIEGYRVINFRAPATTRRGETVLPAVNWLVEAVSAPPAAGRIFRYRHLEGDSETAYECKGGQGSTAPGSWERGEYVYFDACPFVFPPDAPVGDYAISVSLIDTMGDVVGDTSVTVGTVAVVE